MQIKLAPETTIRELRDSITENLGQYRQARPFSVTGEIDLGITVPTPQLVDGKDSEWLNVIAVHQAFKGLPSSILRDVRFWTHLTHTELIGYSVARWSLAETDEVAEKKVASRLFAENDRDLESRHAISRLLWIGLAAARYDGDFDRAVRALTHSQDVLANMIERPTMVEVPAVFNAVVRRLIESLESDKALFRRDVFREVQKELNLACGSTFVEALPAAKVQGMVDAVIGRMLAIPAVSEAA